MDGVLVQLLDRHESLARMLRGSLASMSDEEFSRPPGESAPPAGWHLWHIARWGDRFQASLANPAAPAEIWTAERLAEACGLAPEHLGVLQLGMGMKAPAAQSLPAALGRQRFGVYQERVLDALRGAISASDPAELLASPEHSRVRRRQRRRPVRGARRDDFAGGHPVLSHPLRTPLRERRGAPRALARRPRCAGPAHQRVSSRRGLLFRKRRPRRSPRLVRSP